ncbi:MAG: ATP-dependent helicase, partial [Verrucomicrobia bacterium]
MDAFHLALGPHGRLQAEAGAAACPVLAAAFARGTAEGLLALATRRDTSVWPVELLFWRGFADTYLTALAHSPAAADPHAIAAVEPAPGLLAEFTLRMPAMSGAEYASPELLAGIWGDLDVLARREAAAAGGLKPWLGHINPALHLLGRVTFHLAENKRSTETPFAFMATYTHRLSAHDKPVHLPLGRALQEFAGAGSRAALESLLEPVKKASERSALARDLLESRRLFQPQAWTPVQAHAFLREIPVLEESGIVTRIPDWWKNNRAARARVTVRVGEQPGAGLGLDTLLDFSVEPTLDGEALSRGEWEALLRADAGLVPLRGRWVEVDAEKLRDVLEHWRKIQDGAAGDGVTFLEAMRLLAGVRLGRGADATAEEEVAMDWSEVVAGGWLAGTLDKLRQPGGGAEFDAHEHLRARLRPYQETGVQWLWFLQTLGLGACLADDMGLGKTIQVIAVLLRLKHGPQVPGVPRGRGAAPDGPALLVAPASLLANWKAEIERFAPSLRIAFAHPSESTGDTWRTAGKAEAFLAGVDLVVTTYGQAARLDWMARRTWRLVVLD